MHQNAHLQPTSYSRTVRTFSEFRSPNTTIRGYYVHYSNTNISIEMREDLKGQNLTFTEIAKLVGENWQNLGRIEKAPFEKQANEAKERYNRDLIKYKKTSECKKYNDYLREFRKRQAAQTQGKYLISQPQ